MNMGRNSNLRNEAVSESEPKPEWIGNAEAQGGPKVVPNDPIPLVQPDDDAAHSGDVVGDNVAALKALFPQIVTDGKVDFDVLRQLLGDDVEAGEERYGLNWKGKAKARAHALMPTMATLRPAKDESENWDATQNLMIEGDNLEVLKCLRKAYAGRVKLIYIDPPYNTGNDFVYPDNYTDSLSNYLELTGQRGDNGARLTSNSEASGRFHTEWLNMMYPRLMLARELLRDDGAIFVSIDDSELSNLSNLMTQVFGEECIISTISWKRKSSPDARDTIGQIHDSIVCAIKSSANPKGSIGKLPLTEQRKAAYQNPDNDPRGPWASGDMTGMTGRATKDQFFDVHLPSGRVVGPPPGRSWGLAPKTFEELRADNRIWFGKDGDSVPRIKKFLAESDGQVVPSLWSLEDVGSNDEATKELRELFEVDNIFDSPKPTRLINRIATIGSGPDDIILDFFAGSGTTGHALMALNATAGGNRRFILVQLPEPLDATKKEQRLAADYCRKLGKPLNIAELTKERLRRAGAMVSAEHSSAKVDTGFRVYKLDSSNLKPWRPDPDNLEASLLNAVSNIVDGRKEGDLLVELLLKTGIDLTTPEEVKVIAGKTVRALGGGALIACLADIGDGEAEVLGHGLADLQADLAPAGQTTFFFKDTGFASASAKSNVAAILRQRLGDKIAKLASV